MNPSERTIATVNCCLQTSAVANASKVVIHQAVITVQGISSKARAANARYQAAGMGG